MAEKTNAQRFIQAYNDIDHSLRVQYNFKRSMSFSDIIRRSVSVNYFVRKYEDKLIDYGRLRNAIIHKSNEEYIIAEPHGEVVLDLEKIARLITTPPNAIQALGGRKVITAKGSDSLCSLIKLMSNTGFSNIPIYNDGVLIGVANGQRMIDSLGKLLESSKDFDATINNTKISEIVQSNQTNYSYYEVVKINASIEEILDLFYNNRKLYIVILTKNGLKEEEPIGIISTGDLIELNKVMENY